MEYCKVALVITKQMNIREVLDQLARTKFKATCAVQFEWDQNQFSVDNGMNNVRAVIDERRKLILFCCRYLHYIDIAEELLTEFADEQALLIENLEV
ncbi:hypothetical protein H4F18_02795 [Vibrio scophthalmi]|uniref:hypothetical protein n=1 Tax=Vibrio scophthalmi TaxID=45658 RepID=UPI002FEF6251